MEKVYGKMKIAVLLVVVAVFCAGGVVFVRRAVKAQGVPLNPLADQVAQLGKYPFQYPVKFVCGLQKPPDAGQVRETPVKPGNYATAVNVHNSARLNIGTNQIGTALMLKKAVIARPEPNQGKPSAFHKQELFPDGATEIDCPEIRNILGEVEGGAPEEFIKGFFVIYSSRELDVVGVYTAESLVNGKPTGMSMDVEYIQARRF